jgi:predicted GNAT family N-acyltransferase
MNAVRVTTEQMLDEAMNIRFAVFVDEQGVPASLEKDEYDASPEACRHFLLYVEDKPIAAGRWKTFEPGVAKMQRIAVLKPHRGKGYGAQLLLSMEQDAKASGYEASLLDAQCTAESFYKKLGYETIVSEPFLDAGILHVRMKKQL